MGSIDFWTASPSQCGSVSELRFSPSLSLEMTLTLSEQGNTTCIQDEWKLDLGLPAPVEWFGAGSIESAVAENLTKLKELLESGWVVLQDSRPALL